MPSQSLESGLECNILRTWGAACECNFTSHESRVLTQQYIPGVNGVNLKLQAGWGAFIMETSGGVGGIYYGNSN